MRLDLYLADNGLAPSRSRAQSIITSGMVSVNGQIISKSSADIKETDEVKIVGHDNPYVSRGGLKLEKALKVFPINVRGRVCADLGASTGGFTDVLLKCGASHVYAVDSGHDQLHYSLQEDERVTNMQGVNARNLTRNDFKSVVTMVVTDVSFISLTLILPAIYALSSNDAEAVCLIKPQFEAGREHIGKKGVVKDRKVHLQVLYNIYDFATGLGFCVQGLDYSPIKGPEGNIEYLIYLKKTGSSLVSRDSLKKIVVRAFEEA